MKRKANLAKDDGASPKLFKKDETKVKENFKGKNTTKNPKTSNKKDTFAKTKSLDINETSKDPKNVDSVEVTQPNSMKPAKTEKRKFLKGKKPFAAKKPFVKKVTFKDVPQGDKPFSWTEFKKEKKEVQMQRKIGKTHYDVSSKAKKISEKLRCKTLKGGVAERSKLVKELYEILKGPGNFQKYVVTHDMARMVQYLIKYGTQSMRKEVAQELIPITSALLQSKYGKYCIKRLLKSTNAEIRSGIIEAMYGSAIKLSTHSVSAPIFEYAYSTWATPTQKQYLIQEFFGDMYKQAKDPNVKHLKDVFIASPDMKNAALGATKANLSKILGKNFLDSGLLQSVLYQYFELCNPVDRSEFISQLSPHVVILSNSKDGARVGMNCVWHGINKDRKTAMKVIKEHVMELCKHEHGHAVIISLIDSVDDTVLLNKMILAPILNDIQSLAQNEWGRKILLWLVAPADSTHFHPMFIKELDEGRALSACKKAPDLRRKEVVDYCAPQLLDNIAKHARFWLSSASLAVIAHSILKIGDGEILMNAGKAIVKVILDPDWKIKDGQSEMYGIEHPGLHMTFKKILQNGEGSIKPIRRAFSEMLVNELADDIMKMWIKLNRGCFMLVIVYENAEDAVQNKLLNKLKPHVKLLKKQDTPGAAILLKKMEKKN